MGHIDPTAHIEKLAAVHLDVTIGARTNVWPFASVIRGAKIGAGCSIATSAIVDGSVLGDRVLVSHGAFIDPGIVIGNDVFIGPGVKLCNDMWPRADKTGWDMAKLLSGEFVTTRIEDGASLGAGVIVLPGITISKGAMIAAGEIVTSFVWPNQLLLKGQQRTITPAEETMRRENRMRLVSSA